ncbi:MAG: hypothetical protein EZS28_016625 [Streblomastix strix]|uniref:Uncharacterized protein n=1 Tax=Streblomastix strix TaxID=222440 RepID=A0A5J4W026_9EUKA|nr:MAG: hypothetical protein EZS28_016625 [Streblomastix strix]
MKGKQDPYGKGKVPTNYQRLYLHQHYKSAYVPTMTEEFNQSNGGDLRKLKGAYMFVAAATWDLVLRNLLKIIDTQVNLDTASKKTVQQAARVNRNEIAAKYFGIVDEDEVKLATIVRNLYNKVAQFTYWQNEVKQLQLGYAAPASQMQVDEE